MRKFHNFYLDSLNGLAAIYVQPLSMIDVLLWNLCLDVNGVIAVNS